MHVSKIFSHINPFSSKSTLKDTHKQRKTHIYTDTHTDTDKDTHTHTHRNTFIILQALCKGKKYTAITRKKPPNRENDTPLSALHDVNRSGHLGLSFKTPIKQSHKMCSTNPNNTQAKYRESNLKSEAKKALLPYKY